MEIQENQHTPEEKKPKGVEMTVEELARMGMVVTGLVPRKRKKKTGKGNKAQAKIKNVETEKEERQEEKKVIEKIFFGPNLTTEELKELVRRIRGGK